jgi:hypothetical protein
MGEGQNVPLPDCFGSAPSGQGGGILHKVLLQCNHTKKREGFELDIPSHWRGGMTDENRIALKMC